jgi:hypothetical protein
VRADATKGVLAYAEALARQYAGACPETFQAEAIAVPPVRGAQQTMGALMGCGQVPGEPPLAEAAVMLIFAGREDIYTLQWAERLDAGSGPLTFRVQDWQDRLATLSATVRLCDPVPGEEAPYPTCVAP